ncbi:MAG: hypothetical protein WKF51_05420 [Geodermatophilaceae bacterium]
MQIGVFYVQVTGRCPTRALDRLAAVEVLAGQGVGRAQPGHVALVDDPTAVLSRAGTHVDDPVGDLDDLGLVLHDEDGVALVSQAKQQVIHVLYVMRVQTDRGFVEDVGEVGQAGAEVANHLHPLGLAP